MTLRGSRQSLWALSPRARFAVLTNAASSVGNLAVTVIVARDASVEEFGKFAVAWVCYMLVTGCVRSGIAETLVANQRHDAWREAGFHTFFGGAFLGAIAAAIGALVSSPYLLVVGAALAGLCVFDLVKVLSLTLGRPSVALTQDVMWTCVVLGSGIFAALLDAPPLTVVVTWAGSGAVIGIASGVRVLRSTNRRGEPSRRLVSVWFASDYLIGSGSMQLTMTALAVVASPLVVGTLRAGGTVLSPITLITSAIRPLLISDSAAGKARPAVIQFRSSLVTLAKLVTATMPLLVIANFLPDSLGHALLGESWTIAHRVVFPLSLEALFALSASVAFAAHRAHLVSQRTIAVRSALSMLRICLVVALGLAYGALGASWAMTLIALLGSSVWWISYRRVLSFEVSKGTTVPDERMASSP